MDRFLTTKDPEGRYVAALPPDALEALSARCVTYAQACAAKGLAMQSDKALLCAAVDYYRHDSRRGPVATAFARFSELRQACARLGYAVPPLSGTPAAVDIAAVNTLLAEALSAATPLPGEEPALTQRITADCQAAIARAITALNAPAAAKEPLRFAGLFDAAPEVTQ
jgi:hypothetical protein